jgi:hypothetical protein
MNLETTVNEVEQNDLETRKAWQAPTVEVLAIDHTESTSRGTGPDSGVFS